MKRVYRQPTPLGRDDLEQARADHDVPIICEAAIALALTEPDRQWMESQLVELMRDADGSVRSIAALAVGHLARVHGQIDLDEVTPVLRDLLEGSEARGNAANALDDISTFVHNGNADGAIMRVMDTTDVGDEDADLGPKHPDFAAHFRDPIYDDPADDFAPFGNDEGWDLLAEWVKRADELDSDSTLTQIAPEWFEDAPLVPADLNEDDVDLNDIVISAGFVLLRLTGQIGEADRALVLRALDIRDRTYGPEPETQQMRTDLLTFGQGHQ
ncbi:hypothetical protein ACIG47_13470 [Promicromonospora sp. NPDC052451]|uniref:hypothetical protein n=1 Tax=Promicromonospora sp. NPDC052451 TaxID=3364407 RepID=UPI0037C54509